MKNADVIFWLAVILLVVGNASLFSLRRKINGEVLLFFFLIVVISLALFITSWSMNKNEREKYNRGSGYSVYTSGTPIAGTVWASDPRNTPGLGWVL